MASHAPDVLVRFGLEHVMCKWESLIQEL